MRIPGFLAENVFRGKAVILRTPIGGSKQ